MYLGHPQTRQYKNLMKEDRVKNIRADLQTLKFRKHVVVYNCITQ